MPKKARFAPALLRNILPIYRAKPLGNSYSAYIKLTHGKCSCIMKFNSDVPSKVTIWFFFDSPEIR